MNNSKIVVLIVGCLGFLIGYISPVWSATVSLSAEVQGPVINVSTSATFDTCTYCDASGSCWNTNVGRIDLFHSIEGSTPQLICSKGNLQGAGSCNVAMDRYWYHGANVFTERVGDCNGNVSINYTLFVDNTPSVNATSPEGTVSEPFDITGTATFKPTLQATKGTIKAHIASSNGSIVAYLPSKACIMENCTYSYRELTGNLYDMNHGGPYTLVMQASGGASAISQKTFTVDKTPSVSVTSPVGTTSSPFDIVGTAQFKPTLSATKGTISASILNSSGYIIANLTGKTCNVENCAYSYKEIFGSLYSLGNGSYFIRMTAYGGGTSTTDQKAFTIVPCSIAVTSFNATPQEINKAAAEQVAFSGAISESSGRSIAWDITVGGKTISGAGAVISAAWDTTDNAFKFTDSEGTLTATVTARTTDGTCSATRTTQITVKSDPTKCLEVPAGSTANAASGNLSHSQTLFRIPNSAVMNDFSLTYGSRNGNAVPLGSGWTHTYNISLKQNNNNSYTMIEGDGSRMVLYNRGAFYTPETSAYPVLLRNADGTATLTFKDGSTYSFSQSGLLTGMADLNDNTATLNYDAAGNLITITDPSGRTITLSYDATKKITSIGDHSGNVHAFTYSGNTLTAITTTTPTQEVITWSYTYDSNGFMLSRTDPLGYVTSYTYDSSYKLVQATDPEGRLRALAYNVGSTQLTEKDGGVWTYTYDTSRGVLTAKADPQGNTTSYTYDSNRNRLTETDPQGHATAYTYDSYENVLTITDPLNHVTTYTYNPLGKVTGMTDALGRQTIYTYDARGNLLTVTLPTGAVTQYQYDARGNVTGITSPDGEVVTLTYDQYNNLTSVTDAAGGMTAFTYDIAGNMLTRTDALNNTTVYEYDALNRLVKGTDPLGTITRYAYDANGNRTSVIDGNGRTTAYEYNYKGAVTKITDALNGVTTFTYGGAGCPSCGGGGDKLTTVTDAGNNTTIFEYNTAGRLIKETDPLGKITVYGYDSAGNMTSKTDAQGVTTTYVYDAAKRLIAIQYPDSALNVSYTYDAVGNVLTMTDPSGTTTYTYDSANRLLSETKQMNGALYVTGYVYTTGGKPSAVTYPSGRAVTNAYTAAGRLSGITATKDGVTKNVLTDIVYNGNGSVTSLPAGNGLQTTRGYFANGLLSGLSVGALKQLSYTRDNVGNITAISDALVPANSKTFTYDGLYRLTAATGPYGTLEYVYDSVGNRTTETSGQGVTDYTYSANRLLTGSGAKTFGFAYDDNGNAVADNQRQYIYNQNQRLIRATEGMNTLGEYVYNGNGQRVKKTAGGATTYFIYDKWGNLIEEADGTNAPTADYIYMGSTPVARIDLQPTEALYFYHTDHLVTPMLMTDEAGNNVWEAEYLPFGEVHSLTGAITNNLRFPGQYYDAETGNHYNNFRDYKPEIGRYVQRDPIGFAGGINPYTYPNNPVNNTDPMGLKEAGYGGWEAQFILGYGESSVSCCDGQKIRQLKYRKVCYGAGFTAGISSGTAVGSQGASCKNPPHSVIGGEFGIPLFGPIGMEGGLGGATTGGFSAFVGATAGVGGKATVCFYWLVSNTEKGCCK